MFWTSYLYASPPVAYHLLKTRSMIIAFGKNKYKKNSKGLRTTSLQYTWTAGDCEMAGCNKSAPGCCLVYIKKQCDLSGMSQTFVLLRMHLSVGFCPSPNLVRQFSAQALAERCTKIGILKTNILWCWFHCFSRSVFQLGHPVWPGQGAIGWPKREEADMCPSPCGLSVSLVFGGDAGEFQGIL